MKFIFTLIFGFLLACFASHVIFGKVTMEYVVGILVVYFIFKLLFGKKRTNNKNDEGVEVIAMPTRNKLKCQNCGHKKFIDVSEHDIDGSDERGQYYVTHYRGTCVKCGSYLQERSGIMRY
ncbi:MAG: hypothetical protein IKG79_07215 [Neisseriaceae bacterium]|nr:hypothetical protein [Neisseriaceae bacterium]